MAHRLRICVAVAVLGQLGSSDLLQSLKYRHGFRPLPFVASLISPSLRRRQRRLRIPGSVTEKGLVRLMNWTSVLAVKKPRLCRSVCRTSSITASFRCPFTFPSRALANAAIGSARTGLVRDITPPGVAGARSKRLTELILIRHLARHALSAASRCLSSCFLRLNSAFLSIFSVTVAHAARTQ